MKEKSYVNNSIGFSYILLYYEFHALFTIASLSIDNDCESQKLSECWTESRYFWNRATVSWFEHILLYMYSMINKVIRHMFYQLTRSLRELPVGPHGPNPFRYISCLMFMVYLQRKWFGLLPYTYRLHTNGLAWIYTSMSMRLNSK